MAQATLSFSGFAREDAADAQAQFDQANARLRPAWQQVPENEAHVLIIDMDSMYGHMGWLKAQGSGKITVGLTASARSEADFTLTRPLDAGALFDVLMQIGSRLDKEPEPAIESLITAADVIAARTTGQQPALTARTTGQQPAFTGRTTGTQPAMPAAPRMPRLSDALVPGKLAGPVRLTREGAPVLALDPAREIYAGSATLKPLLPIIEGEVRDGEWTAISGDQFDQIAARSGGPQPCLRLLWLCGLYIGRGLLLPDFNPNARYKLSKWPQTEREFPKHFRIATVMMKGPALLTEISDQSGASLAEVIDYVNAGLLTGVVLADGAAPAEVSVARAASLLARVG
jgi:hypothetical protein